jgi:hypothetical protein
MKYKIKVSEFKKRLKYNKNEVKKNVMRFLVDSTSDSSSNNLVLRKAFLSKAVTRSSVSFVHNRCVITLRRVLFLDYLNFHVIKSSVLERLDVFMD